jgi:WD40 repeat protein
LKLWNLASGELLRTFEADGYVNAVAVSPDGKTALSGSGDTVKLWDLGSGKCLRKFEGHQRWISAVAISQDGKTALYGSADKTLKLWDLATGLLLASFAADSRIRSVTATPDGMYAIASGGGGRIQVLEMR